MSKSFLVLFCKKELLPFACAKRSSDPTQVAIKKRPGANPWPFSTVASAVRFVVVAFRMRSFRVRRCRPRRLGARRLWPPRSCRFAHRALTLGGCPLRPRLLRSRMFSGGMFRPRFLRPGCRVRCAANIPLRRMRRLRAFYSVVLRRPLTGCRCSGRMLGAVFRRGPCRLAWPGRLCRRALRSRRRMVYSCGLGEIARAPCGRNGRPSMIHAFAHIRAFRRERALLHLFRCRLHVVLMRVGLLLRCRLARYPARSIIADPVDGDVVHNGFVINIGNVGAAKIIHGAIIGKSPAAPESRYSPPPLPAPSPAHSS